jgi:hypothetical protein
LETALTFLKHEIVSTPGAEKPFKVVFGYNADPIAEWPVDSREEGDRRITQALVALGHVDPEQGEPTAQGIQSISSRNERW